MNLDILLVITVLLAISQQHKATAQVRPQLIALPADATASCPCGSEGCPELPNCQLESPAPPQLPSACVCGSEGCPAPPDCQNESPALPQSPSGCICGTDGCPVLPNCLPAKPSVQLANCACGTEGCPAPPDCIEAAYAEQPLFSGPEPIQGWSGLAWLAAGATGMCATSAANSDHVYCWRKVFDAAAQRLANQSEPVPVESGFAWKTVSIGHYADAKTGAADSFACGILFDGSASCFGSDFSGLGLLGAGVLWSSSTPLPIAEGGPWRSVSAGFGFACATKYEDSSAWCWGSNSAGQLGCGQDPAAVPFAAAPCRVQMRDSKLAAGGWSSVVAGYSAACAVPSEDRSLLFCWGLLNGTVHSEPLAVPLGLEDGSSDSIIYAISMGSAKVCVVLIKESLVKPAACFSLAEWPPKLVVVPGVRSWEQLAVGKDHKCGIESSGAEGAQGGSVLCWGANQYAQCGTGNTDGPVNEPTAVAGLDRIDIVQVEAGDRFTCARSSIGDLYCWGGYEEAQGSSASRRLPADGSSSGSAFPGSLVPVLVQPPASQPVATNSSSDSTNVGAIVGGVVGGVAGLAVLSGAALFVYKRRRAARLALADSKGEKIDASKAPTTLISSSGGKLANTTTGTGSSKLASGLSTIQEGTERGSSNTATSADWSSEFVRSDQLLSWISIHVMPETYGHTRGGTSSSGATSGTGATGSSATSAPVLELSPELRRWELDFGQLQMQRACGRGSYGRVYLASYSSRPVAVKVLLQLDAGGSGAAELPAVLPPAALAGLFREASVAASIQHPNVVSLVGVCSQPPALVSEYCARGSLTDVLHAAAGSPALAAQLTWPRRLQLALGAARGMHALHSHSPVVLHRDLKGPNLLITEDWQAKVTDFNLSKLVVEGLSMQSTQNPVNPRWLAPELVKGARATTASDVFSYGSVLYELLTWKIPWAGAEFWMIVSGLTRGERPPIPDAAALPGPDCASFAGLDAYCALMQSCWAQDPSKRPGFEEIVQCLRRLLEEAGARD